MSSLGSACLQEKSTGKNRKKVEKREEGENGLLEMVLLRLFLEIGHNSLLSPLSQLVAFFSDRGRDHSSALPVPLASGREQTLLESSAFPKIQEHQKRKKAGTRTKGPNTRTARWPCSPTVAPAAFLALIAAARPSADCS